MVLNSIEKLLEKYDNAETTLQEETQLRNYFNSNDVAPHLEHYKSMFVYFTNTQKDTFTGDVKILASTETKTKTKLYQWISVAAVAVLMLSIFVPKFAGPTETEREEALLAYNQTIEVLNLVSLGMKEGKEQINTISLVSENINKGTEKLNVLSEFNKATNKFLKTSNTK